jgi:hypothetical protein
MDMEEGFVSFMRRWYYWVGVVVALSATLFGVFIPAITVFMILIVVTLSIFFAWHYYKYEVLKRDKRPFKGPPRPLGSVQEVGAELSVMPDLDALADEAAKGPTRIRANIREDSEADLVERYVPLGEMLFPISFIADRQAQKYQEGSLDIGEPLCLWHSVPVSFSPANGEKGIHWRYHCPKCPNNGRPIQKSLRETTKVVDIIATSTLRSGKMPMMDESLFEAIKRGRGELPG